MTRTPQDARHALQYILDGIEEVRVKLAKQKDFSIDADESLEPCIDILNDIWEVANDHKESIPHITQTPRRRAAPTHDVGESDLQLRADWGRTDEHGRPDPF